MQYWEILRDTIKKSNVLVNFWTLRCYVIVFINVENDIETKEDFLGNDTDGDSNVDYSLNVSNELDSMTQSRLLIIFDKMTIAIVMLIKLLFYQLSS